MLQALQVDGRQRALAHVGISSSAIAPERTPWGHRITTLVQDWTSTYRIMLTEPQKRVCMHLVLRMLLNYQRHDGLAHISMQARALINDRAALVKHFLCATFYADSLSLQEISMCFGYHFVTFLRTDALRMDMASTGTPAYRLSIYMRWVDRSFLMETIDNLQPEAVREGGRTAYMAFFGLLGCCSWDREVKRVDAMLVKTP